MEKKNRCLILAIIALLFITTTANAANTQLINLNEPGLSIEPPSISSNQGISLTKNTLAQVVNSESFKSKLIIAYASSTDTQSGINYSDNSIGINFTVPSGWVQKDLSKERNHIKVKYVNNAGNSILFGYMDLWKALPESEKAGLSKSDIRNDAFTADDFKDMFQSEGSTVSNVGNETINNIEYFVVHCKVNPAISGISVDTEMIAHLLVYDGIMFEFLFSGDTKTSAYNEYSKLLKSIRYKNIAGTSSITKKFYGVPSNASNSLLIWTIVLSIVYTIALYTLPILVYRFLIVKEPVPPDKAKKITIIYGVIAFIIAVIIGTWLGDKSPGGAVFLWSIVNNNILKSGSPRKRSPKNEIPLCDTAASEQGILANQFSPSNQCVKVEHELRCPICGVLLLYDSIFCDKCGKQVSGGGK